MKMKEVILKISEAFQQDVGYGRARIDHQSRIELDLSIGDVIEIEGTKTTAAVVWRAHPTDEGKRIIRIDNLTRKNSGAGLGDRVKIRRVEVKEAKNVVLAPLISKGQQIQFGSGIEVLIKKGLLKRPLTDGDHVIIPGIALFGSALPFIIINTTPGGIVSINEFTTIQVKEEAAKIEEAEGLRVSYEDIGGLHEEISKVREMIELPLKHPEVFNRLGIDPPKGVLLHGPPGTGKTLIAKAVANESGANFITINGPELMSKFYGQSEENFRKKFEEGEKNAPSIIFIDEIDAIAGKRSETHGEVEKRVVSQLLTLMDGLKGRGKLIVIGATNIPDSLDPALRRPGRFDREIRIDAPDRNGRKEILQIHTRGMPISKDAVDTCLDDLADITHGFVGADLMALAREAAMNALRRYLPEIDLEKPIPVDILEKMEVTMDDFKSAHRSIEPSAMREFFVEVPKVTWDDVGGLNEAKRKLRESVEWPLTQPDRLKRIGVSAPRGVLLYGPPGSGKTLLVKAVANESNANFISIKGPEVFSKWVGESEKAVRELFKKAKQVAPSIVFLDELDAVAPKRGTHTGSHVTDSVVNQLLTSIDGLESMEGVVVIGATNRPDNIDPGLLRPGRFDRLILIDAPEQKSRKEILKIHTNGIKINENIPRRKRIELIEKVITEIKIPKDLIKNMKEYNQKEFYAIINNLGKEKDSGKKIDQIRNLLLILDSTEDFTKDELASWLKKVKNEIKKVEIKKAIKNNLDCVYLFDIDYDFSKKYKNIKEETIEDEKINKLFKENQHPLSNEAKIHQPSENYWEIKDLLISEYDENVKQRLEKTDMWDKKRSKRIYKIKSEGTKTKVFGSGTAVSLHKLSESTDNYTGADLEALCTEAALSAVREEWVEQVSKRHFDESLENVRATITPSIIRFYDEIASELGSSVAKKDKSDKDIQYM